MAGIVSPEALSSLDRLVGYVLAESEQQNLIAGSTKASMWTRHVLDSVQLLSLAGARWRHWVDVGSGGGFPGMAIACVDPKPMTLVEPRGLRARFLQRLVVDLGFAHVDVCQQRIENVVLDADIISARAVAPASKLLQLGKRCATENTLWLLPRGQASDAEVAKLNEHNPGMTFHVEQSRSDPTSVIVVGRGRPR